MSMRDSERIEQTTLIELPTARKDLSMYIVNRKGFTCDAVVGEPVRDIKKSASEPQSERT